MLWKTKNLFVLVQKKLIKKHGFMYILIIIMNLIGQLLESRSGMSLFYMFTHAVNIIVQVHCNSPVVSLNL